MRKRYSIIFLKPQAEGQPLKPKEGVVSLFEDDPPLNAYQEAQKMFGENITLLAEPELIEDMPK